MTDVILASSGSDFIAFAERLSDPRVQGRCTHNLFDIVVITFCALLSGVESFVEIELFARERHEWLKKFLALPGGVPSHDTLARVISIIDPKEMEQAFMRWSAEVYRTRFQNISADGKSIAGTEPCLHKRPVHLLNVYAHEAGVVLAQAECNNSGFAELPAIVDCLDYFDFTGTLISVDAASSFPTLARQLRAKKAHYLMAIKGNNASLYDHLAHAFETKRASSSSQTRETRHSRREERSCRVIRAGRLEKEVLASFPDVKTLIQLRRVREVINPRTPTTNAAEKISIMYYISSKELRADEAMFHTRSPWNIENRLHWVLDVVFREDDWRVRQRTAARNLSLLRKIAFNMLSKDRSKCSRRCKLKKAGWSPRYLERILFEPSSFE